MVMHHLFRGLCRDLAHLEPARFRATLIAPPASRLVG